MDEPSENTGYNRALVLGLAFAMIFPTIYTWIYFVAFAGQGDENTVQRLTYVLGKSIQFSLAPV